MGHSGENENPEYERLRAAYDAAFDVLCAEIRRLQCIAQDPNSNEAATEAARLRVDEAFRAYRDCRDQLAECLMSLKPAEMAMAAASSFSGSVGSSVTGRQVWRMSDHPVECREELQLLAYRLWEEAGHPIGKSNEYWYRAEELLRRRPSILDSA
jgi:hypothetical protein